MGFKKVYLGCLFNQKNIVEITDVTAENYKNELKKLQVPAELVRGDYQVKPYFDEDFVGDFDVNFDERIKESKKVLSTLFPDKNIYVIKRTYQIDGGVKYSAHYTVDEIRISYTNVLDLLEKNNITCFDKNVYKCGKFLTSIYTNTKITKDGKKISRPSLLPDDDSDITKYLVSYVEEGFENWDLKFPKKKDSVSNVSVLEQIYEACDKLKVKGDKIIKVDDENDNDISEYDVETGKKYIKKVCNDLDVKKQLDDYGDWIKVMFAIINTCKAKKISNKDCRQMLHDVSKKSRNYDEDDVDKWINSNIDKVELSDKGLGINYLINTCIKNDNPELWREEYEKPSYFTVKKRFEEKCFKCLHNMLYVELNENCDKINQNKYYLLKTKELHDKYSYLCYYERKCDKKGVWSITEKQFTTKWVTDPKIKIYQTVCFYPKENSVELDGVHFNLFTGFKASFKPVKRNYGIIKPFLNHILEVICNGNSEYYGWLIQYFANIIQNPNKKSGVILILQGVEGSGKSYIVEVFGSNIIGDDYSSYTSSPEKDFFGQFNSKLTNKLFSVINEAGNELRGCMDKIKDVSVAPTVNIEKKGKDPIQFANYNNFIGTTNNMNPFDIAWNDRRFVWLKVNPKYVGNHEYFNMMAEHTNHEDFDSSLYHYLKEEVKITITNFQTSRPKTEEYNEIKKRNLSNVIKFLCDRYEGFQWRKERYGDKDISILIKSTLYCRYKNYCEECRYTAYNYSSFKSYFKDIKGVDVLKSNGQQCFKFIKDEFVEYIKQFEEKEMEDNDELVDDEED